MARLEIPEETRIRLDSVGQADLLIGVPAVVPTDELREKAARAMGWDAKNDDEADAGAVAMVTIEAVWPKATA